MIQYINRKDLDVDKYNNCIKNGVQSRVYAFSWYLDIVAKNWDVLVLNDYEAVMPIPWDKKWGLKYCSQPYFCQQLGVFSSSQPSRELMESFIKHLPKKFVKITLNLNSSNFIKKDATASVNYFLTLDRPFSVLFKSFSKGRKHAVKVGEKNNLHVKEISIVEIIDIQKEFYDYLGFSENLIKDISEEVLKRKSGIILGVFKDDELLGGGLFLKSKDRIIYLFSAFTLKGKKLQAASFLIKEVIQQHENTAFILDFEGGNIPNIGMFFKSFGSEKEVYQQYKHYNSKLLKLFSRSFL